MTITLSQYLVWLAVEITVVGLAVVAALVAKPDPEGKPVCTACGWDDEDELLPGLNGDPYCDDCRLTFADLDDDAEWRAYAYN
ncbi:hypothetical protein GCM10010193_69660 [Kitasatospora atroaurantiaca]|uniref:Uncharacterized protein n=1 Tax=Kitasatospora atroaurantiaca TaxID=285545 RepID=A0A561EN51_9ACTN|nr:hypothetical protein [Kitasatospora atroaurantiaca]TWE17051.1 hypothetical protein FB465_2055 [Kitasatospora atroaurantiaca]